MDKVFVPMDLGIKKKIDPRDIVSNYDARLLLYCLIKGVEPRKTIARLFELNTIMDELNMVLAIYEENNFDSEEEDIKLILEGKFDKLSFKEKLARGGNIKYYGKTKLTKIKKGWRFRYQNHLGDKKVIDIDLNKK